MRQLMKFFIFPFLRKIDANFMSNYPALWIMELHLVVYWGILAAAVATLAALAMPIDMRNLLNPIICFFLILGVVTFIFVIRWLSSQDGDRSFLAGNRKTKSHNLMRIFGYIFCLWVFTTPSFVFYFILSNRIGKIAANPETISDIARVKLAGQIFFGVETPYGRENYRPDEIILDEMLNRKISDSEKEELDFLFKIMQASKKEQMTNIFRNIFAALSHDERKRIFRRIAGGGEPVRALSDDEAARGGLLFTWIQNRMSAEERIEKKLKKANVTEAQLETVLARYVHEKYITPGGILKNRESDQSRKAFQKVYKNINIIRITTKELDDKLSYYALNILSVVIFYISILTCISTVTNRSTNPVPWTILLIFYLPVAYYGVLQFLVHSLNVERQVIYFLFLFLPGIILYILCFIQTIKIPRLDRRSGKTGWMFFLFNIMTPLLPAGIVGFIITAPYVVPSASFLCGVLNESILLSGGCAYIGAFGIGLYLCITPWLENYFDRLASLPE